MKKSSHLQAVTIMVIIWLTLVVGTLFGYRTTDVFYVSVFDPSLFTNGLISLVKVLVGAILLCLIMPVNLFRRIESFVAGINAFRWSMIASALTGCIVIYYALISWQAIPRIPGFHCISVSR